jgi:tetratricopeptide (TPR) repeat protein
MTGIFMSFQVPKRNHSILFSLSYHINTKSLKICPYLKIVNKILILSIVLIFSLAILPNSFAEKILYNSWTGDTSADHRGGYIITLDDQMEEMIVYGAGEFSDGKSSISIRPATIRTYDALTDETVLEKMADSSCDRLKLTQSAITCYIESEKRENITIDNKKAFQATYVITLTYSDGTKSSNNLLYHIVTKDDYFSWNLWMYMDGNYRVDDYEASVIESLYSFQSMHIIQRAEDICDNSRDNYLDLVANINDETESKFGNEVSQDVADFVSGDHFYKSFGYVFSDSPEPRTTSIPDRMNDASKALEYLAKNCSRSERFMKNFADYNQNIYDSLKAYKMDTYDQAIKINPNDSDAWIAKGALLFMLGKYDDALKAYDQAIKISPKSDISWIAKGYSLFMLGKYDDALKAYDQAQEIEPGLVINKIRNELLEEKKMFDELKKKKPLFDALKQGPNSLSILDSLIENSNTVNKPQTPMSPKVPEWIKNNAKWWADGQITEEDFIKGIEHLAKIGIIKVN